MADLAGTLHTVFCAECTTYFDWKSAGVYWSHRASRMPGPITRLLACSPAQQRVYPARGMAMGPTFVHPNFADNPRTNETSGSYNKPAAVMFWIREAPPAENYILFIDADMLLRAPIDPIGLGAARGTVLSEHVAYLHLGITRKLPEQFISESAATGARRATEYLSHFANMPISLRIAAPGARRREGPINEYMWVYVSVLCVCICKLRRARPGARRWRGHNIYMH